MTWIDAILNRIGLLWPFVRVRAWERAIRFSYWPNRGVKIETLAPGFWFAFWWFQEIDAESVVQQTQNLPTQSITTKDDVAVSFSMNFLYEVSDIQLKMTAVHDFESSLINLAMIHLAKRVRRVPWQYLRDHQATLERAVRKAIEKPTAAWGVKILEVGLTDLVKARQFRFFADAGTIK